MKWINIITYAIAFYILIKAWIAEHKDLNCPYPNALKSECCGDGCGMAYRGSKPENTDSNVTLFQKIKIASRVEDRTVKWRRSYMLAWVILILVWLTIFYPKFQEFPNYDIFIIFLFICTMVIYYSFSYYNFHHYDAPMRFIRESVDILNKRNTE